MCCCFPGFRWTECCRMLRFACCTRFKRIETKAAVVFTAHLPGLTAEDVQVQVESGNLLRVIGERSKIRESSNGSSATTEASKGQFVRLYKLPANILAEEARAEVDENGVLTITVPKLHVDEETNGTSYHQ